MKLTREAVQAQYDRNASVSRHGIAPLRKTPAGPATQNSDVVTVRVAMSQTRDRLNWTPSQSKAKRRNLATNRAAIASAK